MTIQQRTQTAVDDAAVCDDDVRWLRKAIELSRGGMDRDDGGPFGAVIVKGGQLLAEGWNRVTSSNDPTAHAEIVAIRKACEVAGDFSLSGATLYTSCEPCPMCLSAAYWARLDRVVYAADRRDAAVAGFDDDHIYREVALAPDERSLPMVALLRDEAAEVFRDWIGKEDRVPY